jgi:hypothetical protein
VVLGHRLGSQDQIHADMLNTKLGDYTEHRLTLEMKNTICHLKILKLHGTSMMLGHNEDVK